MPQMNAVCTTCKPEVDAQFLPGTGARDTLTLNFLQHFEERCLVRDTIVLNDGGGIVFAPRKIPDDREKEGYRFEYHDDYNVICRRLVIIGGKEPPVRNPCRPDDPGVSYTGVNVITWEGRLRAAANGEPHAGSAPDGGRGPGETPFDPNVWQDLGQGSDGAKGQRGHDGAGGNPGVRGMNALNKPDNMFRERPPTLNLVALEVEYQGLGAKLFVDWDGQTAGNGGRGQNGGRGGPGMGGRDGNTEESVWGDSCERPPGNGGDAGDGGNGGRGGNGGNGGWAGHIWVISTEANVNIGGALFNAQVKYVYGGGSGGDGGDGGRGGQAGNQVGRKGRKTSECEDAQNGQPGAAGSPEPLGSGGTLSGAPGSRGMAGQLKFEPVDPQRSGTCADLIPLGPPLAVTSVTPASGARGTTVPVRIVGTGFTAAATVQIGGLGVSADMPTGVTGTQLDTNLTIGAAATPGARDLTVRLSAAQQATLTGGFSVVEVPLAISSVVPASGMRGTTVPVRITGTGFVAGATVQVSGAGVTVGVPVVTATQIDVDLSLGAAAPQTARDVTVRLSATQAATVAGGFTVG